MLINSNVNNQKSANAADDLLNIGLVWSFFFTKYFSDAIIHLWVPSFSALRGGRTGLLTCSEGLTVSPL